MTSTWRLLTGEGVGAAHGLALDEALAVGQGRGGEGAPPALRLYTYQSAALVGRYQHLAAEVDLEGCARTGTEWNRRPTGGGAIVMGPGQLGVAAALPAPVDSHPRDLLARFAEGILAGLARLGVDAHLTGKNDLSVGRRKIAGLGLCLDPGGGLLLHASVLADLDVEFMLSVLRIPAAKLADKAVAAVSERVTTVSAETGHPTTGLGLVEVVAAGFAEATAVTFEPAEPSEAEATRAASLIEERYATEAWWSERSPRSDATASAALKTPEGLVRCYLALSGPTIKSALFAGDFSVVPEPLVRFEAGLRWARCDEPTLTRLAADSFSGGTELGVPPEALVECVLQAAERARSREVVAVSGPPTPESATAAPAWTEGSCYFPDLAGDPGDTPEPGATIHSIPALPVTTRR